MFEAEPSLQAAALRSITVRYKASFSLRHPNPARAFEHDFEDARRRRVHHDAVQVGGFAIPFVDGCEHLFSARHLAFGRREHLVRDLDLAGVDAPFAHGPERRDPRGVAAVALAIAEVSPRAVNGIDTVRARGHDHAVPG